jgi:hypothetical protein
VGRAGAVGVGVVQGVAFELTLQRGNHRCVMMSIHTDKAACLNAGAPVVVGRV